MFRVTTGATLLLACSSVLAAEPAPEAQPTQEQTQATASGADAPAQGTSPALAEKKREWVFQFDPNAWYAGISGSVRIRGTPPSAGAAKINDMNLDQPQLTPAGELSVRVEKWRFGLGTFFFNQNRLQTMATSGQEGAVIYTPGQQLSSKMSWNEYEPQVGYEIWRRDPQPEDAVQFLPRLELFGAARLDDMKFSFSQGAVSDSQSQFFAQAIAGVHFSMDIAEQFSINLETSAGGWPGGSQYAWSWDITVGFKWRPIPNVGVLVGYRNMVGQYQDGTGNEQFSYRGGIAGIFFGATIRF